MTAYKVDLIVVSHVLQRRKLRFRDNTVCTEIKYLVRGGAGTQMADFTVPESATKLTQVL